MFKDIALRENCKGQYDRVFVGNDFKIIENEESLQNSVIIKIMTRKGELKSNKTFTDFGCAAWGHIKGNNTQLTRLLVKELLKEALDGMARVKRVENVQLSPQKDNPFKLNVFFTIISHDESEFKLNMEYGV